MATRIGQPSMSTCVRCKTTSFLSCPTPLPWSSHRLTYVSPTLRHLDHLFRLFRTGSHAFVEHRGDVLASVPCGDPEGHEVLFGFAGVDVVENDMRHGRGGEMEEVDWECGWRDVVPLAVFLGVYVEDVEA